MPTIPDMGLVFIKPQPVLFHPALYFLKHDLRLLRCAAKHYEVIGVAHHAVIFCFICRSKG